MLAESVDIMLPWLLSEGYRSEYIAVYVCRIRMIIVVLLRHGSIVPQACLRRDLTQI